MIGYIKGVIEEIEENSILLDHGGMGFRINMPAALLDRNAHKGDQVKIYTHLQVKEDDMQLYGFYTRDDLEVFRLLLNVSGNRAERGYEHPVGDFRGQSALCRSLRRCGSYRQSAGNWKENGSEADPGAEGQVPAGDAFEKKLAHGQEDVLAGEIRTEAPRRRPIQALTALGYSASGGHAGGEESGRRGADGYGSASEGSSEIHFLTGFLERDGWETKWRDES